MHRLWKPTEEEVAQDKDVGFWGIVLGRILAGVGAQGQLKVDWSLESPLPCHSLIRNVSLANDKVVIGCPVRYEGCNLLWASC